MPGRVTVGVSSRVGLSLTPEVRLSLELLHLPAPELRARIEREVAANPLLEIEDDTVDAIEEEAAGVERSEGGDETAGDDRGDGMLDGADCEERAEVGWSEPSVSPRGVLETQAFESPDGAAETTLAGHLRSQFRLETRDGVILAAGDYLVGCLDERGYISISPEQAASDAGLPVAAMEAAWGILRALDPPGVGARDLRDCLLLQLRARGAEGNLAWKLVAERFDDLAAGRRERAARGMSVGPAAVRRALAEIRSLSPHPGRLVGGGPVRYIYPDLSVQRIEGRWLVQVDDRTVPRVRCADWGRSWSAEEKDSAAPADGRAWYAAARSMVRALDRRRGTLERVMECILEEQGEFFERGAAYLRPLSLREIAGRLGLHESTIARVVRSKHAQTPRGLLSLRYFFSGGLRTECGPPASSRAVRARVGALVAEEDRDRPLTDADIASCLAGEGIRIARRTVAKYRVSMRIERAQRRRAPAGPRVRPRTRDGRAREGSGRPF